MLVDEVRGEVAARTPAMTCQRSQSFHASRSVVDEELAEPVREARLAQHDLVERADRRPKALRHTVQAARRRRRRRIARPTASRL